MKKAIFIIVFSLLLLGCEALGFVANTRSNNPVKSDFSYYKEGFKLNEKQTVLRTDGIYLRIEYAVVNRYPEKDSIYKVRRFFDKGQMFRADYVNTLPNLNDYQNVQRGYYNIEDNKISFETFTRGRKEYWYAEGIIKGDTLRLTQRKGEGNKKHGYKAPKEIDEIYVFKEMSELKNSIEPNW